MARFLIPWATAGDRLAIPGPGDLNVVISEPELLIVRADLVPFTVIYVVGHSPHTSRPAEDANKNITKGLGKT